jgi:hypothetical protein
MTRFVRFKGSSEDGRFRDDASPPSTTHFSLDPPCLMANPFRRHVLFLMATLLILPIISVLRTNRWTLSMLEYWGSYCFMYPLSWGVNILLRKYVAAKMEPMNFVSWENFTSNTSYECVSVYIFSQYDLLTVRSQESKRAHAYALKSSLQAFL